MRLANWDRLEAGADVMLRVTRQHVYHHPGEPPAEHEGFKRVVVVGRLSRSSKGSVYDGIP